MAAFTWLWAETSSLMTLRTAVDLGELLTILSSFAPAATSAGLVTGRAVAFGFAEVVVVDVLGVGAGDDLLPLDGPDVAQVVVVQDPDATLKNICKKELDRFILHSLGEDCSHSVWPDVEVLKYPNFLQKLHKKYPHQFNINVPFYTVAQNCC